ncbi:MAG: glycoside hydrolase family 127 protein [Sphingomonas phyllosphaerae]|uniref:beta-L-arabinofuranosidase domain-containing protein n=1 Tax=Sphingomonas phyllosphaerae TaxID=257003 RepID=UPI002FF45226
MPALTRRSLMTGSAALAMATAVPRALHAASRARLPAHAAPLPLSDVRLSASDFATAVEADRSYLLELSADRLLHNFRKYAGLEPKGEIYGGWESDSLAGHTLGHYLTALVLMHQQTGDAECRRRADYIVAELAEAQAKRGTGYVGALGRKRKGESAIVDGEEIFPEVMRGEIRSGGFDLNGSWSPLYTVHKLFAGLLDVHAGWSNAQALTVVLGLATYFERVFAALNDEQMQQVLGCEYGGLNESYAELYARTKDPRWLAVARRIYDRRVLDPLANQEDKLAGFHANTQVPKLVGLARLYELTGDQRYRTAAQFFWDRVTKHHSYVIGGNADREYFFGPDRIARNLSEATCEHCNTYNMLKLSRQLFAQTPDGTYFDYYERAHLNHTLSQINPRTRGFTYFTPMLSGAARDHAPAGQEGFVCCGGSGMEAHAKHGDSIFWEGDGMLLVNLYIPAQAQWRARAATLTLATGYPYEPEARLTFATLGKRGRFPVALRVPAWAAAREQITVNGEPVTAEHAGGYAIVERRWKAGDTLAITLPLELRTEAAQGGGPVAILRGPLVLAADMGPAETPWQGVEPALVGDNVLAAFTPVVGAAGTFATKGVGRPGDLTFVPFYRQYERRSAVYFREFTEGEWRKEEAAFRAEQARQQDVAARSIDVMHFGEMQPERDHNLESEQSWPVSYRGRNGRDVRSGGYMAFTLKARPGPLVLQATYWGDDSNRGFDILVDDVKVASELLKGSAPGRFIDIDYPLPQALTRGKSSLRVRVVPHQGQTAGPIFGARLLAEKEVAK